MANLNDTVICPFGAEWKVVRELGQGSYGSVYLIERQIGSETIQSAMKVVRLPASDAEAEQMMRRTGMSREEAAAYYRSMSDALLPEIQLMSRLIGDSHIVSYQDHSVAPHASGIGLDIYIRMEYLQSLPRWIRGREMCVRDVVRMAIELCEGLETCARQKIVHRDIKPDNIFVAANGAFKLGDFGIAQRLDRYVDESSRKLGSLNYIAPEVHRGESFDARADIYGLGMVMYRLLNDNRVPFLPAAPAGYTEADEAQARSRRLNGEPLPKPAHAPDVLWPVIEMACAYHASDRYASAGALRKALQAVVNHPDNDATLPVEGRKSTGDTDTSPRTRSTGPNGTEYRTPTLSKSRTNTAPPPPPPAPPVVEENPRSGPKPIVWVGVGVAVLAVLAVVAVLLLRGGALKPKVIEELTAKVQPSEEAATIEAQGGSRPYRGVVYTGDYALQTFSFDDTAQVAELAPGTEYRAEITDRDEAVQTVTFRTGDKPLYDASRFKLVDMDVYQCDRQAMTELDMHTLMTRGRAAPLKGRAISPRRASMAAQTLRWTLVAYTTSAEEAARTVDTLLVLRLPENATVSVPGTLQLAGSGMAEHLIDLDPLLDRAWEVCGEWRTGDATLELYADGAFVREVSIAFGEGED